MGEPLVYRLAVDVNHNTYLLYRRDKIRISSNFPAPNSTLLPADLLCHEDFLSQGWHEVPFDGGALIAGVYVYRLTTPNGKLSLKAVKN